jgi:hypothetical protein
MRRISADLQRRATLAADPAVVDPATCQESVDACLVTKA